jgi:hypothetical protein
VIFYGGILGGFVVQALTGGLAGLAAEHLAASGKSPVPRPTIILPIVASAMGVLGLAVLDKVIGPW